MCGQGSVADAKATQTRLISHMLKSCLQKVYDRHHEQVNLYYEISISQMAMYFSLLRKFCLSSIIDKTFTGLKYQSNTTGVL